MKDLETGSDKIKKICDILKIETLEPAKQEAQRLIEEAHQEAREIVRAAEKKSEEIIQQGRLNNEKERAVFQTSLVQASKQSVEYLKQEIAETVFNKELGKWISQGMTDPQLMGRLINALIETIEKQGISADFSIIIPKYLQQDEVIRTIAKRIQAKAGENPIELGDFEAGVQIKLKDRNLIIDMSDEAIRELIEKFIGKSLRKYLFENPS